MASSGNGFRDIIRNLENLVLDIRPSGPCVHSSFRNPLIDKLQKLFFVWALREYGTGFQGLLDADGNPVLDATDIPVEAPLYRFLNMTTITARNCGEWTLWSDAETVLVTAKLMTKTANGLVVCLCSLFPVLAQAPASCD